MESASAPRVLSARPGAVPLRTQAASGRQDLASAAAPPWRSMIAERSTPYKASYASVRAPPT
eukprot:7794523-Alexandrium_andersonii.AAC.1